MGNVLNEKVEQAIDILWLKEDPSQGETALKLLQEAADAGDGDAYFFLARCYFGPCYVKERFGFPEDDEKGYAYLEKSLELGSAVGMLGANRVGGFKPKKGTLIYPPYTSNKQIWDVVSEKISGETSPGQIFLKYMVANAYYYGDVVELMEIPESEINAYKVQSFMYKAANLYEDCIKSGFRFGINNVVKIFESGDYIPPNPQKVMEIKKMAADTGSAEYETMYGKANISKNLDLAEEYLLRGAKHGDANAYSALAGLYTYGGKRPADIPKALEYILAGLEIDPNHTGLHNYYGELYFNGSNVVPLDYYKAVEHFEKAIETNKWGSDMLGTCYLKGLGTYVDYAKAKELFSIYPGAELCRLGLGEIYCFGLGVPQDIKKGMEYLDKVPNHPRTKEIKSHFKKGLFGWKQIKDRS